MIEFFISPDGTLKDASGDLSIKLADEKAAIDFAVRLAQDMGAQRYSIHYGA